MLADRSYARITLALDIVRKLARGPFAGYHELAIVKHQTDLFDEISVADSNKILVQCDNPHVPCDERNICFKAVLALQQKTGILAGASIGIRKNIPVMGGMAGGSSNAWTTLSLVNTLWDAKLTNAQLRDIGRSLGMDVPYYCYGNTCFDSESTGTLTPIATHAKLVFVVVLPEFGVSTKEAYGGINYTLIGKSQNRTHSMQDAFKENNVPKICESMHNDFELSVFKAHPQLAQIKQDLLLNGCIAAAMTGSGSTIIGIAEDMELATEIAHKLPYRTVLAQSRE